MKYSVDRIEGKYAVCEDENGNMHDILLSGLPDGCKEGSILSDNADGTYSLDEKEQQERRKRFFELQNSLFEE